MKKRNLKSLNLNKKSISNLNDSAIKGGTGIGSGFCTQATFEDGCVLSLGVLRCGATSVGFICAAACAPDDK